MAQHVVPRKVYIGVFAALLALLALTVAVALVDLGPLNTAAALLIALVKAVLVILFFMHVRYSERLIWIAAIAAFVWLGILLVLTMSDYRTRGNLPARSGWTLTSAPSP
jgi:cytochrome c oxidase subunit 4